MPGPGVLPGGMGWGWQTISVPWELCPWAQEPRPGLQLQSLHPVTTLGCHRAEPEPGKGLSFWGALIPKRREISMWILIFPWKHKLERLHCSKEDVSHLVIICAHGSVSQGWRGTDAMELTSASKPSWTFWMQS